MAERGAECYERAVTLRKSAEIRATRPQNRRSTAWPTGPRRSPEPPRTRPPGAAPAAPLQRAKDPIPAAVGTIVFGYDLPWSRTIVAQACRAGRGGTSRILGRGGPLVQA